LYPQKPVQIMMWFVSVSWTFCL